MATVHLISGLPCAGKTTYASRLQTTTGGVHLSLDFWLITTFGRYVIDDVGHDEHVRRVLACRSLIWSVSAEFLRRGVDVILDDGFFLRNNRREYSESAQLVGAEAVIHFVDTPRELIAERLMSRNASLPEHNFQISGNMLDEFYRLFEAPTDDEEMKVVVVASES